MSIYFIVIYAVVAVYMLVNFKYDIQMFQQNSYRIKRYWKWLASDMGSARRLVDVALLFLIVATLLDIKLSALIVGVTAIVKIIMMLRRKYKKPLVFTKRVWRLYAVTAAIALGASAAVAICTAFKEYALAYYSGPVVTISVMLLICIFSWAVVIAANVLLMPVERMIQQRYVNDAKRILRSMPDLKVVGITGSYGKTSTKHYLTRILSEKYDVLMTPGSFNTPMGVVRTVREYMKPYNQIFVCEMGAKQKGDIKEICDIVHPDMGIVTAVGPMHLESFKTIENVCSTKFELVDSLPSDGVAVVNDDFAPCAAREVSNTNIVRYGVVATANCDYRADNVKYTPEGTYFTVTGPDGFRMELYTRLLGECNVSDILAAVVIALKLGVSPEQIKYAVAAIDQVEHRLSIKQTPGGVTILDDAFNSNPAGSKMALDVLSHFKDGKRIVVTPGMIELGTEQYNLNKEFGRYIGEKADVAIIVGEYNRDAIVEGIRSTGFDTASLHEVATFNEAQTKLSAMLAKGDTILYENDLPDTFK
ncbi:MAG: UDP-N-acetylmuramoyl-tripeptide--D-alanyl-D-alanine ligase [Candidatus Amulumruptor caecigallinarius]|nr:UDP-N-acetylmuramoyl-tripeptide--D-alanyl-D-alanine ligase [Candidatus Amulumruptor caecigallinarius]